MFRLFFGSPGCGKTTYAVSQVFNDRKKKRPVYDYHFVNFECSIARKCSMKGIGTWTFPEHSYLACDESGVEFNSRLFKKLPAEAMEYFKEHRHYKVDIDFFSQSWHDTDLVIRDLCDEVWHLKKLGPWTLARRIQKKVDIDEQTHKPDDMYYKSKMIKRFLPFPFHQVSFKIIFRPKYYRYFNTHERKQLPVLYFGALAKDESFHKTIPSLLAKGFRAAKALILSIYDRCVRKQKSDAHKERSDNDGN